MSVIRTEWFFGDQITLEFSEWTGHHDNEVEIQCRLYRINVFSCEHTFHVPRDQADPDNLPLHIVENELVARALSIFKPAIVEKYWKSRYSLEKMKRAVPIVAQLTPEIFQHAGDEDETS